MYKTKHNGSVFLCTQVTQHGCCMTHMAFLWTWPPSLQRRKASLWTWLPLKKRRRQHRWGDVEESDRSNLILTDWLNLAVTVFFKGKLQRAVLSILMGSLFSALELRRLYCHCMLYSKIMFGTSLDCQEQRQKRTNIQTSNSAAVKCTTMNTKATV